MPSAQCAVVEHDFYLGEALVQPSRNRITVEGVSRRVEPKAMDVLVHLAIHPGQVVTKEELLGSVWADSFVTEHVLAREIWQLRQALPDGNVIQNVPKRGYMLIADVRPAGAPPAAACDESSNGPAVVLHSSRWPAFVMAGSVAIALITLAAWTWRQHTTRTSIGSLAVLPLANFSGDASQDFLADGITEELTTNLSKIGALRVISRTSAMHYKSTKKTIPEIARELNVDGVIEGSVQRSGTKIRITIQLVHAASERHLWAQSYTRDISDVLELRDELANAVAEAVQIKITATDRARLMRGRTTFPDAQDAFLRGMYFFRRGQWDRASEHFADAVAKDPAFALAWANLAESNDMRSFSVDRKDVQALRDTALMRARNLDRDLPEVHDLIADLKFYREHSWAEGEAEYRRVVELDPGSVYAWAHYSFSQFVLGRYEIAWKQLQRALSLDPLNPFLNVASGRLLHCMERYDEAIQEFHKVIELDPTYTPAHLGLALTLEKLSRTDDAVAEYLEALRLNGSVEKDLEELREAFHNGGISAFHKKRYEKQLPKAQRNVAAGKGSLMQLAEIYAGLGKLEESFKVLDDAYDHQVGQLAWINVYPEFAQLRADPRYRQWVRRMNFPE